MGILTRKQIKKIGKKKLLKLPKKTRLTGAGIKKTGRKDDPPIGNLMIVNPRDASKPAKITNFKPRPLVSGTPRTFQKLVGQLDRRVPESTTGGRNVIKPRGRSKHNSSHLKSKHNSSHLKSKHNSSHLKR